MQRGNCTNILPMNEVDSTEECSIERISICRNLREFHWDFWRHTIKILLIEFLSE